MTVDRNAFAPDRDSLIDELSAWGVLSREDVTERWRAEEAQLGANVNRDVRTFGVTPHHHDAAMERLYRDGFGFIFETLCYWLTPDRQAWSTRALERLERYRLGRGVPASSLRILMLGDGTASDSLLLVSHGYAPDYFDVADSVTSEFVRHRIASRGLQSHLKAVTDYADLIDADYDVVWCFDVLEHLPDLPAAVRDLGRMVAVGGMALITESCRYVRPDLPTHLRVNAPFHARIPAMMRAAGLCMMGYTRHTDYRPVEYRKLSSWQWWARWQSWRLQRRTERSMAMEEVIEA